MRTKFNPLDQYYTKPEIMVMCVNRLLQQLPLVALDDQIIVDASCGDNRFVTMLKTHDMIKKGFDSYSFDIDPALVMLSSCSHAVLIKDFTHVHSIDLDGRSGGILGFNPPFGYHGQTALAYLQHFITLQHPNLIGLILPDTLLRRLSGPNFLEGYVLEDSLALPQKSFYRKRDDKEFGVASTFCIWRKL